MSKLGSRLVLTLVLGVGSIGLAACGGGDDSSSSAATSGAAGSSAPGSAGVATSGGAPTSAGPVGDVPIETWAGGVCGAVNTWLGGINANGTKLNQDVQGISDLGAGRDLLVRFMQDAVALTDTMISSVQAAGAPAVANGQQLSADLVQALSPVKQTFESAVTKAQQLPTNDPAGVQPGGHSARQRDHELAGQLHHELRRAADEVQRPRVEQRVRDGARLRQARRVAVLGLPLG